MSKLSEAKTASEENELRDSGKEVPEISEAESEEVTEDESYGEAGTDEVTGEDEETDDDDENDSYDEES